MNKLTISETNNLIEILENRFKNNMHRHQDVIWEEVLKKLLNSDKLWSLNEMEKTGGEPDVVKKDQEVFIYYDFSKETPINRRNVCYDKEALDSRKKFKPENDALSFAKNMGINILDENEYRFLQSIEQIDLKTSSWLLTPLKIRKLGGAIFGDNRYNQVFIYHNGAESYYSVRGFRGYLII